MPVIFKVIFGRNNHIYAIVIPRPIIIVFWWLWHILVIHALAKVIVLLPELYDLVITHYGFVIMHHDLVSGQTGFVIELDNLVSKLSDLVGKLIDLGVFHLS